jgi:glutamate-ammonia-ligase adenylyltransferase
MGKLGAFELNYSSDIDLIFAYEDDGVLPGKKEMSYGEFYTRLAQALVRALDEPTAEGFVFRVDTRLRPFGDSGPLVMTFEGMERYYQAQAREWERYAMVKARVVAGDEGAGRVLQDMLTRFVYRRYLDFRAFGELRDLKRKISRELQRKDRLDNVKLGLGGIREIEFIGQAFQLIRGGQAPALRERGILKVLALLGEMGQLPQETVARLQEAYRFLRLVENRIQQYGDQQTHDLPLDEAPRMSLAYALDYPDWAAFKYALDEMRAEVHGIFSEVIDASSSNEAEETPQWLDLDASHLVSLLADLGVEAPEAWAMQLAAFQASHAIRRLTARGVEELNRLLPMLLRTLAPTRQAEATLGRILKLLEAVASRNVYFTLLAENPTALAQLVKLAGASAWIASYIASHPLLLDELLDPRRLYSPLSLDALQAELRRRLGQVDVDDMEQLMTAMRQFKQANVLRIAAADIMDAIPVGVVSDYLTWLAETLIGAVLEQAWRLTTARHGLPPGAAPGEIKGFAVIAYGKMGGIELSYASDLDLVFLYGGVAGDAMTDGPSPLPCAQFYARVGKRMINLISTQLLSGALYEIDLRLRPSGNSGLLASSLEAYETYQMESAWTWEQQALVRARCVAGDAAIGQGFAAIRRRSLGRLRERAALRAEVRQMREKMRENLANPDPAVFDLKQGTGGIADIEFIVQFGVLSCACEHEILLQKTAVAHLLDALQAAQFLAGEDAAWLKQAYYTYRERGHRAALDDAPALAAGDEYQDLRAGVRQIWRNIMESDT